MEDKPFSIDELLQATRPDLERIREVASRALTAPDIQATPMPVEQTTEQILPIEERTTVMEGPAKEQATLEMPALPSQPRRRTPRGLKLAAGTAVALSAATFGLAGKGILRTTPEKVAAQRQATAIEIIASATPEAQNNTYNENDALHGHTLSIRKEQKERRHAKPHRKHGEKTPQGITVPAVYIARVAQPNVGPEQVTVAPTKKAEPAETPAPTPTQPQKPAKPSPTATSEGTGGALPYTTEEQVRQSGGATAN